MIKDIKSKFSHIPDSHLQEYYYVFTKLKHKALKEYGFKFDIEISDNFEPSEYGFSSTIYDDTEKKATGRFNLSHMKDQIKLLNLDEEHLTASIFGTLYSSLFHNYLRGLLHFNFKDEIEKHNVSNLAIDFIHLYFCEDILNFPEDQIYNKLNYLLQEMYHSGEFESKDELSEYCLKVLNPVAFQIARNHSDFLTTEFKNEKKLEQLTNNPSEAPTYDTSSTTRN